MPSDEQKQPAKSGKVEEVDDREEDDEVAKSDLEGGEDHAPTEGGKKKRKRKGKGKVTQALNNVISTATGGKGKDKIPQVLVDAVVQAVNAQGGVVRDDLADAGPSTSTVVAAPSGRKPVTDEEARKALEISKAVDVLQGKTGIGGKNAKEMGEYKFWKTQPVVKFGEQLSGDDGPIEPSMPPEQVRQDPYQLPTNFVWSQIDMEDPEQKREVFELLSLHYVEDKDAAFRFKYSAEFLAWRNADRHSNRALTPPGYHKEWHIGIRGLPNNKLVGFISAIPLKLRVRDNVLDCSEVNWICIHKKLRSKRLAPVLIKEVTRQCHLKGIFQAIYTAGAVLPTPISTARYYHRTLNIPKLVDVNFTYVPRNSTFARMVRLAALPANTSLSGLREMEERDLDAVESLLGRYLQRFKMYPQYSKDEVRHNLLSGRGEGEIGADGIPGRRSKQVVWTYVVENPDTGQITDFFSFYSLPSTIIKSNKHSLLEAAYLFYYATDVALQDGAEVENSIQRRLKGLIGDAVILANNAKFDVVNAMTLMDNWSFLEDLKFGPGDGYLNFYLYNWRTQSLEGHQALEASKGGGQGIGRGLGVVML
ncbi:glycylpeptide N-tetradecanoyltransferase [Tulasnella sp. UAMH 9824]|nr:glycylpeptide N-tetradecanoyltransferase [Tulasnella sp. UAMH 9824]